LTPDLLLWVKIAHLGIVGHPRNSVGKYGKRAATATSEISYQ